MFESVVIAEMLKTKTPQSSRCPQFESVVIAEMLKTTEECNNCTH